MNVGHEECLMEEVDNLLEQAVYHGQVVTSVRDINVLNFCSELGD